MQSRKLEPTSYDRCPKKTALHGVPTSFGIRSSFNNKEHLRPWRHSLAGENSAPFQIADCKDSGVRVAMFIVCPCFSTLCDVFLVAACLNAKILAEKRQDMILKAIRHGAGVRA